jgi:hypothetical protein
MTRRDYIEEMIADILDYISDSIDTADYSDRDELEEHLSDELWTVDSVTGNASGSYTFSAYQAEENLAHAWDLLEEVADESGQDLGDMIRQGAEYCDVSIRCYLLGEAIAEALDQLEADENPIAWWAVDTADNNNDDRAAI